MATIKPKGAMNFTEAQEMKMREAYDQLKLAQEATREAYKLVCAAADLDDNAGQSRKICNHAATVDTLTSDLGRTIHHITETYMGIYEPECQCGMSSRCSLHSPQEDQQ